MERAILHCDLNNFYASVECMLNPELNAYPVAVCGEKEERQGIVLAKNMKAKMYGVSTGEAIWQAKRKCKDLVTVPPHYDEYVRISEQVRGIYNRYTDQVESFGMDECWLDVTASEYLFGDAVGIAEMIRNDVKSEVGVTVSVGVSFNKIFAKLGSDMKKPDAVTVIPKAKYKQMIGKLPASDLLGVGRNTAKQLHAYGVYTIEELAEFSPSTLRKLLGKNGEMIWRYANGLDDSPVVRNCEDYLDKTAGHGITLAEDLTEAEEVWKVMLELSQEIGHRMYLFKKKATGVAISIKSNNLSSKQWQKKLDFPTQSPFILAKNAFDMFCESYQWETPIRAVTVRAIGMIEERRPEQIDMFTDGARIVRNEELSKTVEKLRNRYGDSIIKQAVLMGETRFKRDIEKRAILPFSALRCL
ncbi:MAG: DNA polymerase IV [Ruminococcaceae bacterium]|nr:DNA polymerase IV [Oscillospiraceae bacterium]